MKIKKSWLIGLGLIILLFIPIIIEKINPRYITAGDALSFWGAIIGATVAISGVWLTLKSNRRQMQEQMEQNQKVFKEERRLNVRPRLSIKNETNGALRFVRAESYEQKTCIVSLINPVYLYEDIDLKRYVSLYQKDKENEFYSSFSLLNVGVGSAIGLKFRFFKSNIDRNKVRHISSLEYTNRGLDTFINEYNVNVKEKFDFTLILKQEKELIDIYIIKVVYRDIYNEVYFIFYQVLIDHYNLIVRCSEVDVSFFENYIGYKDLIAL